MKVVITRNSEGFLSKEAIVALYKAKDPHVTAHRPEGWFAGDEDWKERFEELKRNARKNNNFAPVCGGMVLQDWHDHHENRSCPKLIHILTKLGKKANGPEADIAVVQIPDDIEFEIHGGAKRSLEFCEPPETIHEKHRVWK